MGKLFFISVLLIPLLVLVLLSGCTTSEINQHGILSQNQQENDSQSVNEITNLADLRKEVSYVATYQYITEGNGLLSEDTYKLVSNYPNIRVDGEGEIFGVETKQQFFSSFESSEAIKCLNPETSGEWDCFTIEIGKGPQAYGQLFSPFYFESSKDVQYISGENINIIGEQGSCYQIKFLGFDEDSARACYSDDGILLYYKYEPTEKTFPLTTEIKIIKLNRTSSFTDDTFTPPIIPQ